VYVCDVWAVGMLGGSCVCICMYVRKFIHTNTHQILLFLFPAVLVGSLDSVNARPTYIHTCMHTYIHKHAHTHIYTRTPDPPLPLSCRPCRQPRLSECTSHTHTHTQTHAHTHKPTHTHTHQILLFLFPVVLVGSLDSVNTPPTYIHTCIHTYTNIHTHTHTRSSSSSFPPSWSAVSTQ
jgi:hypothetical protein